MADKACAISGSGNVSIFCDELQILHPLKLRLVDSVQQTGQELKDLLAYVEDLRDREEQGEDFEAEQADTLGSQAQRQAEAIAGQVTQAAEQSGIEIQDA